jgi:hypothetical protein
MRTPTVTLRAERRTAEPARGRRQLFRVFDVPVGFTSRSPVAHELLTRLYGSWPAPTGAGPPAADFALETPGGATAHRWQVWRDGSLIGARPSFGAAMRLLEYEICLRVLTHRPDLVVIHAATIYTADGIMLVTGHSGAGKTTLALALTLIGCRVGGDDLALLDPRSGVLQPAPRCAHLDRTSWRLLRRAGVQLPSRLARVGFVTPADLGTRDVERTSVRRVLVVQRGPGAVPALRSLTQAEALLALLPQARWPAGTETEKVAAVGRMVGGARCYRLATGDLPATLALVSAMLDEQDTLSSPGRAGAGGPGGA